MKPCAETGSERARSVVWTVATAPNAQDSVAGQTRQCLAAFEPSLEDAGSGKTRILSAQIFLVDMATKPEMDEVWNAWIGPNPDHWPQRACACTGAALADGRRVEIILLAAKS
jgi:enamine deaminase RidA (YjgF/YER057c/UK114 family)